MISLRRHVLTLVAVFLALAIGVVLGSTTVTTSIRDALVDRQESTAAQLEQAIAERDTAQRQAERLDGMAAAVRPVVADKVLDKRPVLLLVAPGVTAETTASIRAAVTAAGATEAGVVTLTDKSLDTGSDTELQTLVENLPIGDPLPAEADPGTRLGTALGRAALLHRDDAAPQLDDDKRATVFTTLADAGFISYDKGTVRPGQLLLMVTGPGRDDGAGERLASVARSMDAAGAGAVVAGGADSDGPATALGVLRAAEASGVSTVDDADSEAGALAVVLALSEQLAGGQGHYGFGDGASAAIPTPRR